VVLFIYIRSSSQLFYGKVPDAASLEVVVEHAVILLPDDVLWLVAHQVAHHAAQLNGRAPLVDDLLLHLRVPLVHDLDLWHYKT
jgi:hypothetical protein